MQSTRLDAVKEAVSKTGSPDLQGTYTRQRNEETHPNIRVKKKITVNSK